MEDTTPPIGTYPVYSVMAGQLSDAAGNPYLDRSSYVWEYWTSGDDIFAADDSKYAPILMAMNSYREDGLIVMLDTANVGGECYHIFAVHRNFSSANLLASNRYGFSSITFDSDNNYVYFCDNDTGRIFRASLQSGLPSTCDPIGDGTEPVPSAFLQMPNTGLVTFKVGSVVCLAGISHPWLPSYTQEGHVAPQGKYYLWKWHPELTDRVELFVEDYQNAWEALGLLAEAVNYQVGIDPDGTGFFRPSLMARGASNSRLISTPRSGATSRSKSWMASTR